MRPASARPVPRALRRRVLRAVRAEPKAVALPRSRRLARAPWAAWVALGLAVAAALVVGLGSTRRPEPIIPARAGRAQLHVDGGHGELVVDRLAPLPPGRTYELWMVSRSGKRVPSTLFGVTSRGTADLGVPGELHQVSRLLVTVEPRGGSIVPTSRAVIQIDLARVPRSANPT